MLGLSPAQATSPLLYCRGIRLHGVSRGLDVGLVRASIQVPHRSTIAQAKLVQDVDPAPCLFFPPPLRRRIHGQGIGKENHHRPHLSLDTLTTGMPSPVPRSCARKSL